MSIDIKESFKGERKELRKFGITFSVILFLWGMLFLWRGRDYYPYLFMISAAFFLLGLFLPLSLSFVRLAWMKLSAAIGWLMTRLILSILFYLIVAPIGLVMRLLGKDFLNTRLDRNAVSYWITREPLEVDKESYQRQF